MASRIEYLGVFDSIRDNFSSTLRDMEGWSKCVHMLQNSRLYPNPWPIGGGASRFECYAFGVPTASMGLRTDPEVWSRKQFTTADIPFFNVAESTAYDIGNYKNICLRCLNEERFAEELIEKQKQIASELSCPERFWEYILKGYRWWLGGGAKP